VVNDGKHTTMYIEGCPTVDNPSLVTSPGITQLALPWALGGYEYGGSANLTGGAVARPAPQRDGPLSPALGQPGVMITFRASWAAALPNTS
jgi:hypothetical protein